MLQKLSASLVLAQEKDASLTLSSDSSDAPATQDFSELLHSQQEQQEHQQQSHSNGQSQPSNRQSIDGITAALPDGESARGDGVENADSESQLISDAEVSAKFSIDLSVELEQQTNISNIGGTIETDSLVSNDELQVPSDAETFYALMQGMKESQPQVNSKGQIVKLEDHSLNHSSDSSSAHYGTKLVELDNTLVSGVIDDQVRISKTPELKVANIDAQQPSVTVEQLADAELTPADIKQLIGSQNPALGANQLTTMGEKSQATADGIDDSVQTFSETELNQDVLPLPLANEIVSQWNREFQASSPVQQQQMLTSIKQALTPETEKNNPVTNTKSTNGLDGLIWSEQKQILALDMTAQDVLAQTEIIESDVELVPRVSGSVSQVLADVARSLNLSNLARAEATMTAAVGIESFSAESFSESLNTISNNRLTTPEKAAAVIDMTRPNANQKLAETVNVMLNSKHLFADIRLDPADLGMMQVRITMNGEQANINFVVQSQQTQAMIEQSTQRLRDILQSQGVNVGETTVSQDDQPFSQHSKGQQGEGDGSANNTDDNLGDASNEDDNIDNITLVDDGRIDDFA